MRAKLFDVACKALFVPRSNNSNSHKCDNPTSTTCLRTPIALSRESMYVSRKIFWKWDTRFKKKERKHWWLNCIKIRKSGFRPLKLFFVAYAIFVCRFYDYYLFIVETSKIIYQVNLYKICFISVRDVCTKGSYESAQVLRVRDLLHCFLTKICDLLRNYAVYEI